MVTMSVAASISKLSSTGNPPPTAERAVSTYVRTEAGRPAVISGLIQQDIDSSVKKTPALVGIPLPGLLF